MLKCMEMKLQRKDLETISFFFMNFEFDVFRFYPNALLASVLGIKLVDYTSSEGSPHICLKELTFGISFIQMLV